MKPFDIQSALLAKHAQHVVLVHFPIALFIANSAFDLLARWRRDRTLATAAYYNLIGAAVTALPTVATGLIAWQWQLEGARLKGNLRLHLILGLVSGGMIWLLAGWRARQRKTSRENFTALYLAVELVTVAVIALTGHLGGILSGVEGQPG